MRFIFLILLPLLLYSSTPIDSSNIDIYKNTYILNENVTITNAINNKNFSKTPSLYLYLNNRINHDFWIKIPIENQSENNLKKALLFFWKNANLKIYYYSSAELIGPHLIKEKDNGGILVDNFNLKAKSKSVIYIHVLDRERLKFRVT